MKQLAAILAISSFGLLANAAEWTYTWQPGANDSQVTASVSPLKYGKSWAYSIEFDDGTVFPVQYAEALISQFKYTDAPPGVAGGKERPFVATCAINPYTIDTPNTTILTWTQLKSLMEKGWGIVNHSYWHTGVHWDPDKMNSPDQFQRELFWSLTMIGLGVSRRIQNAIWSTVPWAFP